MECDYQTPDIRITHVDDVVMKMIYKHEPAAIFREVVVMDLGDYMPELEMNYN
tara:strand:- start:2134 stop:2292 length:159 start_codon:yes stop_codon:yes gene_type:complete